MKKYLTTSAYRKHNLTHSKRLSLRRLKWKKLKKGRNRRLIGLSRIQSYIRREITDPHRGFKKVIAPKTFSFIDEPELIIKFISQLQKALQEKKKVYVILRFVELIDYDAIIVLLSIMIKFKSQNIEFNGDLPKNIDAKNILQKSGFFRYLYLPFVEEESYNLVGQNIIHTHASKNVDAKLGMRIIETISQKIWNEKRIYKGFQRTLIELMQNTNNHAAEGREGEKHWWLSVNLKLNQKKATFAFIDYGVGIFNSLNNKKAGNKFHNCLVKLRSIFSFSNNAEILKLILDGQLHKTVSNQYYRGKGLPGIKEAMDRDQISGLVIITNNVYANIAKNEYRILRSDFIGTFIYWELHDTNTHFPWTNLISA